MAQNQQKKYIPDLNALAQRCQLNYVQLLRLMPRWETSDSFSYDMDIATPFSHLDIDIVERFQFTTSVRICVSQTSLNHLGADPQLLVRLYHDARMAEVIEEVGGSRRMYKGRYPYPNASMYQPDEKMQLNSYLGEWLANALKHGLAKVDVFPNEPL